ncbi:MAG: MFS transporter, partial [Muribaculaceae bacterium]|nr:MFS transporter [Muribaculaceae bacterium]
MTNRNNLKVRLSILNFIEFAVWGSYLTSLGNFLFGIGLGEHIGWFYAMQGIV